MRIMKNPKRWLGAVLGAAMLAQVAMAVPPASAAADPVAATGLPETWSAASMYASESANPGATSASFASNRLSLSAEAGKIDSSGDNVVYAFMPAAGDKDYTFTARVSSFSPNPSNGWASLMVKDGSDAVSKMVSLGLHYSGSNYVVRDYRRLDNTGGGTSSLGAELAGPVHLRIQRTGNNLAFSYSADGGFTYQSRTNFNDNDKNHYTHLNLATLNVGLAVSSGSAVFDQISFIVDGHEVFDSNAVVDSVEPPGTPDGVIAIAKDGAVDLSWNTVTNATYYQIKGGTADGGPYPILLDDVSETQATINGLTNGIPYYFVVAAGNINGLSGDSGQTTAIPASLTVPGKYELSGFATYTTGGGILPEDDPAYRQVTNAAEFHEALKPGIGAKVIEIMNDLDLGWLEIPESARTAPFSKHNDPLLHPVLLKTGVSKITIDNANGLTLFSRNGSAIRHTSLVFRDSSNIVIRNLRFDELWEWDEVTRGDYDRNDWDYISLENKTSGVWIDHSTFGKSYDGVVDAKGGSNGITISWSRFEGDDGSPDSWVSQQIEALDRLPAKYPMYAALLDAGLTKADIVAIAAGQKKGHLIGASEGATDNADLELTLHHNQYTDMMDRIPRLRAGNAHVYNIAVNNAGAHAASKRLTPGTAASIAEAGYHFGVTGNGAISTEGGAVLLESSVITDVLYPVRNNQKENLDPLFTGAIQAVDVQYSLDGVEFTGDSDDFGSPLAPMPAAPIPFAWNTASGELPYLYEPDETSEVAELLSGDVGSGAGAGELFWPADNWLRTSGYEGAQSDAPNAPPTAPAGLLATAGDGEVKLRWGEVGMAASYKVYRGESPEGPFEAIDSAAATASYTDTETVNGSSYFYFVTAVNGHGESGQSALVTALPQALAIPAVPADAAASGGATKIAISWQPSEGADYYRLYRRVAGSDSFAVLASPVFETSFDDRSAAQGMTYEYAATAVNGAGESSLSDGASAELMNLTELSELRLLLEDTFDEEETGTPPQHYAVIEESGTLTVAEVPSAVDKSMRFFDDRTGVVLADRTFEAQTSIVGASFDFMQESKANSVKVFRLVTEDGAGSTSNTHAAVAIETNGGHLAYRTNGGYVPFLMNYDAGVWYSVDVVANLATAKADIYVDGELALEQVGLFNAATDIAGIQSFTANNNSANAYYLDNVRVYGEKEEETGGGDGGSGIVYPPSQPVVSPAGNGALINTPGSLGISSDGTKTFVAELASSHLEQAGRHLGSDGKVITLQLEGESEADRIEAELPIAGLLSLLNREADGADITLELRTSLARYRISTAALWSAADLEKLESLPPETVLALKISKLTDEQASRLEDDAEKRGLALLSQPIDFVVSIDGPAGNNLVSGLGGYAARLLPLAEGADQLEVAGAVYDSASGAFTGVPAFLAREGNASYALLHRTGNSIYVAVEARRAFDDMTGHWARAEVEGLANRLFIEGAGPRRFAPDESVTRAQFAAMLVRALGLAGGLAGGPSAFDDVDSDAWYAEAVAAAHRFGMAGGFGDGTFRPDDAITREQMAAILERAMKRTGYAGAETQTSRLTAETLASSGHDADLSVNIQSDEATVLDGYADAGSISEWARLPLAAMVEAGIMQGTPAGMLEPGEFASRAEAAAMLSRLLHALE